ncbi:hypothetical protein [Halorarius halobius]|uniref:hypothetical protein n=1 Tax=Halorarius halobius TaxID=2962671 RepID=UPI0020CF4FA6|nr:hypothetical protein [Halorarius halobius]
MTVDLRPAFIGFVAAALGTLAVGLVQGMPLAALLPLAALVGVLFAAGNLFIEHRRSRPPN